MLTEQITYLPTVVVYLITTNHHRKCECYRHTYMQYKQHIHTSIYNKFINFFIDCFAFGWKCFCNFCCDVVKCGGTTYRQVQLLCFFKLCFLLFVFVLLCFLIERILKITEFKQTLSISKYFVIFMTHTSCYKQIKKLIKKEF